MISYVLSKLIYIIRDEYKEKTLVGACLLRGKELNCTLIHWITIFKLRTKKSSGRETVNR
jgi:hypothetical protein